MRAKSVPLATALGVALGSATALAGPVTFTGSSGSLSASVTFDTSGTNLLVTLENTSAGNPSAPSDILTGVIFTLNPANTVLSKASATVAPGDHVKGNGGLTGPGGDVGGEWAYQTLTTGTFAGKQSIYSSGYFSGNARFETTAASNLQGPASVDGVQYGITTTNDGTANDNGGLKNQGEIVNAVNFVLGNLPTGFHLSSIADVRFQYGTSLEEPHFSGSCTSGCSGDSGGGGGGRGVVPEPASALMLGAALLGLGLTRRRRRLIAKPHHR